MPVVIFPRYLLCFLFVHEQNANSGDAAQARREFGFAGIIGRNDDVIKVSGHRLGSAEIESAFVAHPSVAEAAAIGKFFFWTAWVAGTNRPGETSTYTNNWPHEPLIGNRPTAPAMFWTGISIIMLLAGICAMVWHYAGAGHGDERRKDVPVRDPLWNHIQDLSEVPPHLLKEINHFFTI